MGNRLLTYWYVLVYNILVHNSVHSGQPKYVKLIVGLT